MPGKWTLLVAKCSMRNVAVAFPFYSHFACVLPYTPDEEFMFYSFDHSFLALECRELRSVHLFGIK